MSGAVYTPNPPFSAIVVSGFLVPLSRGHNLWSDEMSVKISAYPSKKHKIEKKEEKEKKQRCQKICGKRLNEERKKKKKEG
jgi:hypothetical protein